MQKKNSKKNKRNPFKSFRRSYREEIHDDFEAPGLIAHAGETFSTIFKNWKFFLKLLLLTVVTLILFVGILNEDSMNSIKETIETSSNEFSEGNLNSFAKAGLLLISTVSTGGLNGSLSGEQGIVLIFVFLLIWLMSIFYLRYVLSKKKITFRDCLYNSFSPLVSTFLVFLAILIELIPVFLCLIFYNAAVKTDFLSTPFYALLFIAFAALMVLISGYLVSGSVIALVAVTSPGLYPSEALGSTWELVFGRRLKLILRLIFLSILIGFMFVVVMLPIILLDSFLKSNFEWLAGVPVVSFFLLVLTCFSFIYLSVYIYLYYRKMLEYES